MAIRYYEPVSGDLKLWSDPTVFVKTDLQDELAAIEDVQALNDNARTFLAGPGGLVAYEESLEIMRERLENLIDFFDYSNTVLELDIKDGAWFTPDLVESVLGEDPGNEAVNSIDGNPATFCHD